MAIIKIKLLKDWLHPVGIKIKAGENLKVTPALQAELLEGGYIAAPKKTAKKTLKNKI